jgi:hypothetical protein
MKRVACVALILCLGTINPAASSAASLELAGSVGLPLEIPGYDRHNSLGFVGTIVFGDAGPFVLGAGIGKDSFENKNDDGSSTFTTLYMDFRIPFVRRSGLSFFGVVAPEIVARSISYSQEAQAANSLIPSSETDGNLGLALGTGFSIGLAGEWLSLVSTQKLHMVWTDVSSSNFFVVSFGVALSNLNPSKNQAALRAWAVRSKRPR